MKIGIDIGGNHIAIALIDGEKIIQKIEKDITNEVKLDIENFLIHNIKNAVQQLKQKCQEIELIGISICGIVKNNIIIKSPNLSIEKLDIVNKLNFDIPVIIRNDTKCAGLAEVKYGSLQDTSEALFLTIGTGIGGAYYLQGKTLEPKRGSGLEVGHMVIEKNGCPCKCGRFGCFEQYASISALKRDVINTLKIEKSITGIELLNILKEEQDKQEIKDIIDNYTDYLSIGLSNLINILEPEKISIGGSFVYYKEILLQKTIDKLCIYNNETTPEIVTAKLKNDAGIIGSIL